MMFNLFIMFDPMTKNLPLNYMFIMIIMLINYKFWMNMNKFNILNMIIKTNKNKSNMIMFNSMIKSMLMINLLNMIPYMFSNSHNITFTLNLTLILWMMMINFSINNKLNILFMNLSPKNTSLNMILIINTIELNSMLFTIMSLSMRLMINMMMSHLILSMMNSTLMKYMYLMIELLIINIQTYIFFTLNNINFNNMN